MAESSIQSARDGDSSRSSHIDMYREFDTFLLDDEDSDTDTIKADQGSDTDTIKALDSANIAFPIQFEEGQNDTDSVRAVAFTEKPSPADAPLSFQVEERALRGADSFRSSASSSGPTLADIRRLTALNTRIVSGRLNYDDIRRHTLSDPPRQPDLDYKVYDPRLFIQWCSGMSHLSTEAFKQQLIDIFGGPDVERLAQKGTLNTKSCASVTWQQPFDQRVADSLNLLHSQILHEPVIFSPPIPKAPPPPSVADLHYQQIQTERARLTAFYKPRSFSLFPDLLPQIRLEIWKLLIQTPRLVPLHIHPRGKQLRSRIPVPTVLQINQESRYEALKSYILWGETNPDYYKIPGSSSKRFGAFKGRTYLNCEFDILNLSSIMPEVLFNPDLDLCDRFSKLFSSLVSEGDRIKIKRVAAEGSTEFWDWGSGARFTGASFYDELPNLKEFMTTAVGFGLGVGEDGASDLEDKLGWEELDWKAVGDVEAQSVKIWGGLMDEVARRRVGHTCRVPDVSVVVGGVWKTGGVARRSFRTECNQRLEMWVMNFYHHWCRRERKMEL